MDLAQHFLHVNGPHDKAVIVFHKGSDEIHKGMMPAFFRGEMKDVIGEADTLLMIQSHIGINTVDNDTAYWSTLMMPTRGGKARELCTTQNIDEEKRTLMAAGIQHLLLGRLNSHRASSIQLALMYVYISYRKRMLKGQIHDTGLDLVYMM